MSCSDEARLRTVRPADTWLAAFTPGEILRLQANGYRCEPEFRSHVFLCTHLEVQWIPCPAHQSLTTRDDSLWRLPQQPDSLAEQNGFELQGDFVNGRLVI
jgi:hypothetical protein